MVLTPRIMIQPVRSLDIQTPVSGLMAMSRARTRVSMTPNGIGLAAPQVHLSHRLFIYRDPDIEEEEKIKVSVLINPLIEKMSDETDDDWEGCLSIPGMSGLVRRFKKIKYSGMDLNGEKVFGEVEGIHARVLQHEFDHLNGILYTSRLADKRAFGYSEEIEKFWKKNDEEKSE